MASSAGADAGYTMVNARSGPEEGTAVRVWADGARIPADQAVVPVLSSAVFRGTSVFDVLPVVRAASGVAAVGLYDHLRRFCQSMAAMDYPVRYSLDELAGAVGSVMIDQSLPAVVRMVALIADTPAGVPGPTAELRVFVTSEPAGAGQIGAGQIGAGSVTPVRLQSAHAKLDPAAMPPWIKVAAIYAAGLRAERRARAAGFDSIVNRDTNGDLLEGVSSSVGLVVGGTVRLPPLDVVLDSITRRLVVDVARSSGIEVRIEPIPAAVLASADAAFVSSSTRALVPVAAIDDRRFDLSDPVLALLSREMESVLAGRHSLSPRWLTPLSLREQ